MNPKTKTYLDGLTKARIAVLAAAVIADEISDWPGVTHPNATAFAIGIDIADAITADGITADGREWEDPC